MFGSADELGQFVENGIHNRIHGAVASAFSDPIVAGFHSPRTANPGVGGHEGHRRNRRCPS